MISLEVWKERNDKITKLKTETDKLKGTEEQLFKNLEKEFGVKTLKEGDALLVKDRKALEELEKDIGTLATELEDAVDWNAL
jgi:hypothetical protein